MKKPTPKTRFHAGGAWKVAYGDFVTGMMALFLVLWITTMKTDEVLLPLVTLKTPTSSGTLLAIQ